MVFRDVTDVARFALIVTDLYAITSNLPLADG